MKTKLFIVPALAILLVACEEFTPEGTHYADVSDEPTVQVAFDLFNLPDTVTIFTDIHVRYNIDISGPGYLNVYMAIDNDLTFLGFTPGGTFTIKNQRSIVSGYKTLRMFALTTSGTGSMADKTFREILLWQTERVLHFNNAPPVKMNVVRTDTDNGTVYLHWNKYPEVNLVGIKVHRSWYKTLDSDPVQDVFFLTPSDTVFHDDTFLGEKAVYTVTHTNFLGQFADSDKVTILGTPATLKPIIIKDDSAQLIWSPTQFYLNSRGYSIQSTLGSAQLGPGADTSYTFRQIPIGGKLQATFTELGVTQSHHRAQTVNFSLGEVKENTNLYKVIQDRSGKTFAVIDDKLIRYPDKHELTLFPYASGPHYVSPDNSILYVSSGNKIWAVHTATMTHFEYTLPNTPLEFVVLDGKIYYLYKWVNASNRLASFDMATGVNVASDGTPIQPEAPTRLALSPDGNWLLQSGAVLIATELHGDGTFTESVVYEDDILNVKATFIGPNEIRVVGNQTSNHIVHATRFSFPALTPTSAMSTVNYTIDAFDNTNQLILTRYPNSIEIRDMQTDELIRTLNAFPDKTPTSTLFSGSAVAVNGYLAIF